MAVFLIMILSPFLILISVLVLLNLGYPIFFIQKRAGYKCKEFGLIKFRTMNFKKNNSGDLLPDEDRITLFGKFLRSSSIDELPELFNIARGDLSFIGPRPFISKYLPLYSKDQIKRHQVKPGLSGWAQINGRNLISWNKKFEYDVWYVNNQSLFLDIKILIITIFKVLTMEGINSSVEISMKEFKGD